MAAKIEDKRKLAKLLTAAHEGRQEKIDEALKKKGSGHVIGITGAAAQGKSTLIDKIIGILRKDGWSVIVLAIDPSDQESGGAILADMIRMRDYYLDDGVFLRSLSSRGSVGASTPNLGLLVNVASRFADFVIVESAGAGQADTGIKEAVDTFVYLPDINADAINLMKSGIHDYAHIFAVNLRAGGSADEERFLARLCSFVRAFKNGWQQLVFRVNAYAGSGVEELVKNGVYCHRDFLRK